MGKQKKTGRRLDPEDVLEGRARPRAAEILALIHEVNPSGHDLPAKESARRYALKSRLQSLLVERFAAEILVEPTSEPGVVGLRHRTSGADACHAVVAALDDRARSWVQLQLDLGGPESGPPSVTPREPAESAPAEEVPLDELSTAQLVERGREALAAYDFEAARACLEAAVERGSAEAAPILLGVLVEQLGLDADALAVEARLAAEALKRPEVRLLLALAAARAGDRDRAIRLVKADEGDAAAEVFVALARGALAEGALDRAARDVAEAQRRGPSHPAGIELSTVVKKRRAEERAPLEAEAQRLLDEGRFEEAEAKAAALAARWPESAVAHAIARAGEERRRRDEARALAAEGHAAVEKGEIDRALLLLRRAAALGLAAEDAARVEEDQARAEAAARARHEEEKALAVAHALQGGYTLRGLTDYAGLDEAGRAYVKARVDLAELVYLDETGIRGTGPEAKAAAQAVMAVKRAVGHAANDPAGVLAILGPHWAIAQRVGHAVAVTSTASQRIELAHKIEATQRFSEGMQIFSSGRDLGDPKEQREVLARAIRVLSSVRREHLDEGDARDDFDRILVQTRRMAERLDLAVEVGKLNEKGDLLAARAVLDQLIRFEEDGPADDKKRTEIWRRKRAEVVQKLTRAASLHAAGPPAEDALAGSTAPRLLGVPELIVASGEIVLVEGWGHHLFLQAVDPESGKVARRASFRLSHDVDVHGVQQRDGHLALATRHGLMEIDPESWEPHRMVGVTFTDKLPDQVVLAPGGRFLWYCALSDATWTSYTLLDIERGENGKLHGGGGVSLTLQALAGLPEPRVVVIRDSGATTVLYEPRGAAVPGGQHEYRALPHGFAVHPGGGGLCALLRAAPPEKEGDGDDREDPPRVHLVALDTVGAPRQAVEKARRIEDLDPEAPYQIAAARDAGLVFVLYTTFAGSRRLVGLDAALSERFAVEVPARVSLVQDGDGRRVAAISPGDDRVEVVPLGATAPAFAEAPPGPPLGDWLPSLVPVRPCAPRDRRLWTITGPGGHPSPVDLMFHVDLSARTVMLDGVLDRRDLLAPRYAAALGLRSQTFAEEIASAVRRRYPGDPQMAQLPAMRAARAGDWARVRDLLAPIDPGPLSDPGAQHHDHLLGAALLMLGDVDEARRVLARGAARAGGWCDLSVPLALAGLPGSGPVYAVARRLDHAVREADERLARGDRAGARHALAGLVVREAREVQALARLCRAHLGDEGTDRFARRVVLATFCRAHADTSPITRRELRFPGARWDTATLDALAREAGDLLEAEHQARLKDEPDPS